MSLPRAEVQSLVRELKSHKPHSTAKKKKNQIKNNSSNNQGFHGGPLAKNLPANAVDKCLIPDLGASHMPRGN